MHKLFFLVFTQKHLIKTIHYFLKVRQKLAETFFSVCFLEVTIFYICASLKNVFENVYMNIIFCGFTLDVD